MGAKQIAKLTAKKVSKQALGKKISKETVAFCQDLLQANTKLFIHGQKGVTY